MGVPKRLTEKQMKFAQLVVSNEGRKTGTECAIEAGYDKDTAYVRAQNYNHQKNTHSLLNIWESLEKNIIKNMV